LFALLLGAAGLLPGATAPRPAPKYLQAKPDQAEGAQVLQSFRSLGIQGTYWLKFDLRVMPHKGDERVLHGEMFGTHGQGGPLSRLSVHDSSSPDGDHEQSFIFQSGKEPSAWIRNSGQHDLLPHKMEDYDLLARVSDTDLTLFDLLMPFLHWADYVYEGVANVRGRPAHVFLLYPPVPLEAPAGGKAPSAVRVFLDTQFSAMTQVEWLDADGKALKTVTVLDLKKVGEQWLVKSIDVRNLVTRDKTRLAFKAVALDLVLPAGTFAPDRLAEPAPPVPREKIQGL
jgi:hypothetical protein